MKKYIAMILTLVMVMTLFAGCGKKAPETEATNPPAVTTQPTATESQETVPAVSGTPASALELLESVWNVYGEDQKFAVIGGSMAAPVDGAPGSYDITDENITYSLLIPAEQLTNVTEAASMIHMMNANTFTAAAFMLADGVSASDFGAAMEDAIMNNQWICGFPEVLLIQEVAEDFVVVAFGAMDLVEVFQANLVTVYPASAELVNEPLV